MTRRVGRPDGPGRLSDVALRRRCFVVTLEDGSNVRVQATRAMSAASVARFKEMAAAVRKTLAARVKSEKE